MYEARVAGIGRRTSAEGRGPTGFSLLVVFLILSGCSDPEATSEAPPAPGMSDSEAIEILQSALRPPGDAVPPGFEEPLEDAVSLGGVTSPAALRRLGQWEITGEHPLWPLRQFVLGEAALADRAPGEARSLFWELARWGASDPFEDRSGGNSLAVVALWRVVQIDRSRGAIPAAVGDSILATADALLGRPVVEGLFRTPLLATLPKLEESLLRALPRFAVAAGRDDEAVDRFLDYQNVTTDDELDAFEENLLEEVTRRGRVSRERLDMIRADRLVELRDYAEALELLRSAWAGDDLQIRSRAGLRLASLLRTYPGDMPAFREAAGILDTLREFGVDPALAEEALFQRALLTHRLGRDAEFVALLEELIARYPSGRRGDDALFQLASFTRATEPERALELYGRLRAWRGENDWRESAWYFPAITLFGRAAPGDLASADSILGEFLSRFPDSELRQHAGFWSGRIREALGDRGGSAERFDEVIAVAPYDYYGIRSMMHRTGGPEASRHLRADPETRSRLKELYSAPIDALPGRAVTPHQELVALAVESGLYGSLLPLPGMRLEELPVGALAAEGLLARVAVLLSLRQAALFAANGDDPAATRLRLANLVGRGAGDWPLSTYLTMLGHVPRPERSRLQAAQGFLGTAYPGQVYRDLFASRGRIHGVDPSLLYSLARHESAFSPTALSSQGALGLFQFMPLTLDSLSRQLDVPQLHPDSSLARTAYVFDPERNIDLWARWFTEQLRPYAEGAFESGSPALRTILGLIEHHAGRPSVREFVGYWEDLGTPHDVEYAVEVAPLSATRNLLRRVLGTLAIVDAIGIFEQDQPGLEAWEATTSGNE